MSNNIILTCQLVNVTYTKFFYFHMFFSIGLRRLEVNIIYKAE